jgi:hypothetical protein
MSGMRRNHEASLVASWARAARGMAAQMRPLARSTGAATGRGVRRTRAWAAPQVERAGQALQHSVAPRASAMLSSAARRIEPAKPRRGWRKLVGISMVTVTGAASAVAAVVRSRRKQDLPASAADMDAAADTDAAAKKNAGGVTPDPQPGDGQAKASADTKGPVRTS